MGTGRYDSSPSLFILFAALAMDVAFCGATMGQPVAMFPATMPHVATVDKRYQSRDVEMAEVIGGKFWKPYGQQKQRLSERPTSG